MDFGCAVDSITLTNGYGNVVYSYKNEKPVKIKEIIYNPPATIVMWDDGTKTIVKVTKDEIYNPIFGVLMAYYQKQSGMTKTQIGKFCDNILKDCKEQIFNKIKKGSR